MRQRTLTPQAGQTLIEFVVVILVVMLIILGIVDLARAVYARSVIAGAAREGARYGITRPADLGQAEQKARDMAVGLDPRQLTVRATQPDSSQIQVDVTYTFQPVSLLIARFLDEGSGAGLVLRSRSLMRIEK